MEEEEKDKINEETQEDDEKGKMNDEILEEQKDEKDEKDSNKQIENNKNEDIGHFFQKTLKNTLSAFFLSLIYTIINFICNIPLLRTVSKESYGVVKVYFEFAFHLVSFVPRETMRRSAQKFCPDEDKEKENEKLNTISQINYLFMVLTSFISVFVFFSFYLFTDSEKLHQNMFQLLVYIICAILEFSIEPIVLYMNLHVENKFLPITMSSLSRVISNTIFTVFFGMDLWAFTLSRVLGSSVYIGFILALGIFKYKLDFSKFFQKNYKSLIFGKSAINGTNIVYLREVLFQFIKLNLLTMILSKCQDLVLSFAIKSSIEEKSDYSFISQNYSLISRFLLEPINDAFYNLVNKFKHIEKRDQPIREENDINKMNDNIYQKTELEDKEEQEEQEEHTASIKSEELMEGNNEEEKRNKMVEQKKEINYDLSIKLLQLFLKVFTYTGILIIPYYILIGTEVMGLIYGEKWQNNNIDKIGDSYSFCVIIVAVSNLIKNFANATNDAHQMNLSYISLISNAIILSIFMYLLSKWDICGLIITNVLSAVFLIDFNLYIIFCGKKEKIFLDIFENSKLIIFKEIQHFIDKCFISKNSIFVTSVSILAGYVIKKFILENSPVLIKIIAICAVGLVNVFFLYKFEYKKFMDDLDIIKSYQM